MRKLRVLDLFSGIGGFSLGLERAGGFETVACCEIDPYASKVLEKNFPCLPNLGDIETAEFPNADFITAGFPCQDISYAGAGAGLAGARSGLWRHVVRALRVVRPRGALLENVAALLTRGLGTVLGDLAEIGYDAEWHCIPAAAVGAPHRRDRIWIIANPGSEQHESCRAPIGGEIATQLSGADPDAETVFRASQFGSEQDGNHARAGALADAGCAGLERARDEPRQARDTKAGQSLQRRGGIGRQWEFEPGIRRVAHGIPSRVDRLRCLGNAVVPQIPEIIGRAIIEAEAA